MPGNATTPKQAGAGSGSAPQSQVKHAGEEAKQQAEELAQRASETATNQASSQKDRVAEKLDHVAGAIDRVRTEIQEQDPTIAKAASAAAEQTERFAAYLRHTDVRQMLSGAEDLARRRPVVFLAGAFAAGLAVTRFAKASQSGEQQSSGQDQHAQDRQQAVPVAVGASGDMYTTSAGRGSTASAAASAATPPVSER